MTHHSARLVRGSLLALALSLVACDRGTPTQPDSATPPVTPPAPAPDLNGTPDLVVDASRLASSWVVYDQSFPATSCSVQESSMSPGDHRVLRFTVSTPNVGTADVYVGDPLAHMAADDGLFEYANCHQHLHYRNYAIYELMGPDGRVLLAAKRGFCMLDVAKFRLPGAKKPGKWEYRSCGTMTSPGHQGISVGWADVYDRTLDGQFFVLDEPGAEVPPGDYTIRISVNPPFVCGDQDGARPRDAAGMCHNFPELDYDNNVGETRVTIPVTVTATGAGPGSGQTAPKPGLTRKPYESN